MVAGAPPFRRALALRCAVVLLCTANHFAWANAAPLERRHVGKTCTDLGFSGLQLCSDCNLMSTIVSNKGKALSSHVLFLSLFVKKGSRKQWNAGDAILNQLLLIHYDEYFFFTKI